MLVSAMKLRAGTLQASNQRKTVSQKAKRPSLRISADGRR
jgi:hypothetical protein